MLRRKEYDLLNQMLDSAIAGDFREDTFDETELSKLQTKLMRYLSSSSMSEQRMKEEKNRLKELITDISHQTKTPLTSIIMYSELLCETADNDRVRMYADEISVQSRKLEYLIEALVKMSRLETGIFQYQMKKVPLERILENAVNQCSSKARAKNITVSRAEGDGDPCFVCADEKWVTEAVFNILDNAVKYSPEGSGIIASVFSYEMFSGIRITDQGIGIKEDEVPRIFSRFYRGTKVHDKEGIGVGLFLARQIIEGHGGYIKVKSKEDQGSTFDICLPNMT